MVDISYAANILSYENDRTIVAKAKAAAVVVAVAAVIRLNVITGSDKMLFFNHEAIDSTYIFKYFYGFVKGW